MVDDDGVFERLTHLLQQLCCGYASATLNNDIDRPLTARMLVGNIDSEYARYGQRRLFVSRPSDARLRFPSQRVAKLQSRISFFIRAFFRQPVSAIGDAADASHRGH